jgi:acetamidase/formamidase
MPHLSIGKSKIHFGWDNSVKPAIEMNSGEIINVETKDCFDGQITGSSNSLDLVSLDPSRDNPVTGPILVNGAEPGDSLKVEILDIKDLGWGMTAVLPGFGLLREDSGNSPLDVSGPALKIWKSEKGISKAKFGDIAIEVQNDPFIGTIGTAPYQKGKWLVIPPRNNGGNMDIKQNKAGSTLFLPVSVSGGLLSLGDSHLAQGDGEVCGTAIEAPTKVKLRVSVLKSKKISDPYLLFSKGRVIKKVEFLAIPGISTDLMEAAKIVTRRFISAFSSFMEPVEAYMLASVCMDLGISEIVDLPNYIVTGFFPLEVITDLDQRKKVKRSIY